MPTVIINGTAVQMSDAEREAFCPTPVAMGQSSLIPVPMLRQRVEKLGLMDDFSAYLFQYPPLALKLLSLESGVNPTDPSFAAAFSAMQISQAYQDYILAPAAVGVPEAPPNG